MNSIFTYLISCSNMTSNSNLKLNPKRNSSFKIEMSERRRVETYQGPTIEGTKFESLTNINLNYSWDDIKIDGSYKAHVHFDSVQQLFVDKVDMHQSNELNSPDEIYQKGLKAFSGASFLLNIEDFGHNISFDGYDQFRHKFDLIYTETPSINKSDLNLFFGREYFMHIFKKIFSILPDTPLSIGSSWTREEPIAISDPATITVTYNLVEIKNNIIIIKTTFKGRSYISSYGKEMQMAGSGEGIIELDAATGDLIKSKNSITTVGNTNIGGINIQMKIFNDNEIKSTRIQ